ncbi:MAG: hypothetical protein QOF06_2230 [Solirubrobacterales bacterium]|jgi:hypothetical protein|nr:hypothetical protein [Solirubrobacterales bacterium]
MRGNRDLQRACLAAIACALVAALVPWEIVRLVAGLPLTLFLPGYAIVAAAFGSRELAPPKRTTLSFAVSLMVLALGSFVLNIFPFGLETASWAVLLPLVVIAACRGAALRRERPQRARAGRPALPRPATGSLVLLALATAIALGALALAERPLPAENAKGFTALWMLPTDKREDVVAIGVDSNQHEPRSYRLRVSLGKNQSKTYRVALDPGGERVYEVDVPPKPSGRTHIVASLYKEGRPQKLYRRVTSWLPRQMTFP